MRAAIRKLVRHMLAEHSTPGRLGGAVGVGMFIGCLPLYGLHLPISIVFAWIFGLNKATVYLAANISNPLFAPFLVAAALWLGERLRFGQWRGFDISSGRHFIDQLALWSGEVPDLFLSAMLGGTVMGVVLGIVAGPTAWLWARHRVRRKRG